MRWRFRIGCGLGLLALVIVPVMRSWEVAASAQSNDDISIVEPVAHNFESTRSPILDDLAARLSFQFLLTDALGDPLPDGVHILDFFFYADEVGGPILAQIEDVAVTTSNGVGTALVEPKPSLFDGQPRYVGITVDDVDNVPIGDELSPRVPLVSVPYAFRVNVVESEELTDHVELGDETTAGSLQVFGGGVVPDARVIIDGAFSTIDLVDASTLPPKVGVNIDGRLQWVLVNGNDGEPDAWLRSLSFGPESRGQLNLYDATGNTETVELTANVGSGGMLSLADTDGVLRSELSAPETGGRLALAGTDGDTNLTLDGNGGAINSHTSDLTLNADSTHHVSIASGGGQLAVGHSNPQSLLHLASLGGIDLTIEADTNDIGEDQNARIVMSQDGGQVAARIGFRHGENGLEVMQEFDGTLTLGTNNADRVTVASNGNVGVGTTNPQDLLHLASTGGINLTIEADTNNSGKDQNARIVMSQDGGQVGARIGFRDGDNSLEVMQEFGDSLILGTNNSDQVTVTAGGLVGIGTSQPNHELVVQGNDPTIQLRDDTTDNSANAARLELLERAGGSFDGGAFFWWNGDTNKLLIGTKQSGVNTNVLVIDRATNSVGIGTQTPGNYRLAVNGPIRAKEIVVETGWSDFVFDPNYELRTLEEVEAHIKQHGHLPEIPSAEEVAENGVKVGEMESKLLQKVEELTLHLIEMNKRVKVLEGENARLREGAGHSTAQSGGSR